MRILLLGPPGVGKGTYGKLLAKDLSLQLVSVGDLVRDEIACNSNIGKAMAQYSLKGQLIPDDLVIKFLHASLTGNQSMLLDGFPRTITQAKSFPVDKVLNISMKKPYLIQKLLGRRLCSNKTCGMNFNIADILHVAENVSLPPILPKSGSIDICDCGSLLVKRADDTIEIVNNRLAIYEKDTKPLITYYRDLSKLSSFEVKKGLDDYPDILKITKGFLRTNKL